MRHFRFIFSITAIVFCLPLSAKADPTLDRVLSGAEISEDDDCAVVKIGFHFPVRYISYFPLGSGAQLSIRLRPIEGGSSTSVLGREALPAPQSKLVNITDIEYEGDRPDGPALTLFFDHPVYYHLAQGSDFLSILIAISNKPNPGCTPVPGKTPSFSTGQAPAPQANVAPPRGASALMPPDAEHQKILDDARAAMTAKDYPRAIQLLTKFLQGPDNASMPDAQELLGVAREKNGQDAHAKAEYEKFLHDYPDAPGAGRVKQRLAALLARALHPGEQNAEPGAEPPALRWESSASLSEYFYHDEMSTVVREEGSQLIVDSGLTSLQTELVSALDASVGVTGEDFQGRMRVSGSYTKDFLTGANDKLRVGELYFDIADGSRWVQGRIGRQYHSSGGILGRIDGALVSVRLDDQFKVDLIGGFPIDTSYSSFDTKRYAFGASFGYSQGAFTGDLYGLRQMNDGFVDRQSVGAEGRYVDSTFSAFGTLDYDIHFSKINVAILNTNFIFGDQTSLNLSADYRRAPLLRTSDALIGQPVTALSDLLSTYTKSEIDQLALDRTATSTSLFASITHPIDKSLSIGFDATLWNMSGMPASGGVPAIPSSGTQYYFSGHFIATSLLTDGDLGIVSLGYADMVSSQRYTFDFNTRYPVTHDLRMGPRFFASYRAISGTSPGGLSGSQTSLRPTFRLNYRIQKNIEFELDGGAEWERDLLGPTTTTTWNYLATSGIRIDF